MILSVATWTAVCAINFKGHFLSSHFSCNLVYLTGLWNRDVPHNEILEAEVGQNISLPCVMKNVTGLNLVSIEWRKDETKLVVYSPSFGCHYLWTNMTIQIEKNTKDIMGSYLLLPWVNKWDSGTYVCVITSFPLGSTQKETNLIVKGKK